MARFKCRWIKAARFKCRGLGTEVDKRCCRSIYVDYR